MGLLPIGRICCWSCWEGSEEKPRRARRAQRRNIAVHVWTVDDPADMQRFIDMGVDGIITDRPDLLLELLGRM